MKCKQFAAAFLLLLALSGCAGDEYSVDFFSMNTLMRITVHGSGAREIAIAAETRVNQLDALLSRTRTQGALSQFNSGKPASASLVPYLETALHMREVTGGYYDPTIAPLTDIWQIGTEDARVPAQGEIDAALARVGVENIVPDAQTGVLRAENGAEIDLGGLAKGIAADETAEILRQKGAHGLLVLGGNIYAVGDNRGKPWEIGVANPNDSTQYIAKIGVKDLSVVTTGDYERYFEQDGIRYHHVFDPRTGYPAKTDLRSVTIIDADSTRCDAFSTALFVMGEERALKFCEENEVAAVLVTADSRVVRSKRVDEISTFTFEGADMGFTNGG